MGGMGPHGSGPHLASPQSQPAQYTVHIRNVVTELELLNRVSQLQSTLNGGQFREFCEEKLRSMIVREKQSVEVDTWRFMGSYFTADMRNSILGLLGYHHESLVHHLASLALEPLSPAPPPPSQPSRTQFRFSELGGLAGVSGLDMTDHITHSYESDHISDTMPNGIGQ